LENNLRAWAPAFSHIAGVDKIRAVSGPLKKVFGAWKDKEK
jgi:hypothetical protein